MESINVNEIMEGIRKEIKDKKFIDDAVNFDAVKCFDMTEINERIERMKDTSTVNSYFDISSDRKVIGGLFTFVKKVVRRMTCFYVEPIVDDQNQFNIAAQQTIELLAKRCEEEFQKNQDLETKLFHCQRKIEKMEAMLEKLCKEAE